MPNFKPPARAEYLRVTTWLQRIFTGWTTSTSQPTGGAVRCCGRTGDQSQAGRSRAAQQFVEHKLPATVDDDVALSRSMVCASRLTYPRVRLARVRTKRRATLRSPD